MDAEEANRFLVKEYGRLAEAYETHVVPKNSGLVNRLLDLASVGMGDRVLDLGCGPGNLAFAALPRVGERGVVEGIDFAEGMIRVGVSRATEQALGNVRFVVADCRRLPHPDRTFDAVVSCLGVPSVGSATCFREAHRVLRRGGRFAFCLAKGGRAEVAEVFREMLERERPTQRAPEIDALLEARRIIQETGELAYLRRPPKTLSLLRDIGFASVRCLTETITPFFRTADEYLDHQLAWGDNEREWRALDEDTRRRFRREFARRVASLMQPEGLPYVREMLFYFASKRGT